MTNDTTRPGTPAPLSAKGAFVVHLAEGAGDGPETLLGRVEHIVSGRSLRFSSVAELVGFMQRTLANGATH